MTKEKYIGAWLVVLLLALAIGVWPTRYKMERVSIGSSPSVLVRIDRITGKPEILTTTGWRSMEDAAQANIGPVDLPSDQVKKLDAHGGWCISSDNSFCLDLYNGSNWRLTGMSIYITAKNDDGSVKWERRFDKKYLDIAPFGTDKFYIDTGDKAPKHEWYILSVNGRQEIPPPPPLHLNLGPGAPTDSPRLPTDEKKR
jgi:hypothetical protein